MALLSVDNMSVTIFKKSQYFSVTWNGISESRNFNCRNVGRRLDGRHSHGMEKEGKRIHTWDRRIFYCSLYLQ